MTAPATLSGLAELYDQAQFSYLRAGEVGGAAGTVGVVAGGRADSERPLVVRANRERLGAAGSALHVVSRGEENAADSAPAWAG